MPANNSSSYFSSGSSFLLLPIQNGGLDGVLFDDGRKDMPLDDSANVILSF